MDLFLIVRRLCGPNLHVYKLEVLTGLGYLSGILLQLNDYKLEDDQCELHDLDVDCFGVDCLLCFGRPMNVEPKFKVITKCSLSCQAGISATCELRITWDNLSSDVLFTFVCWVGNDAVDVGKFVDH